MYEGARIFYRINVGAQATKLHAINNTSSFVYHYCTRFDTALSHVDFFTDQKFIMHSRSDDERDSALIHFAALRAALLTGAYIILNAENDVQSTK